MRPYTFPQLLNDPFRGRVLGHVEVQDFPAPVLDDEETVEELEGHRRHHEKVEGRDHLTVVVQESKPPLTRVTMAENGRRYRATLRSETTKPSF